MMELVIAALALALIVATRGYLGERAWRMDVEAEVDEWRRKDWGQWTAAEQAKDDAQFAAEEAAIEAAYVAKWGRA